jgi:hypothetical protein
MKRRHLVWWAIAGPFAVLLAMIVAAHPYLSITERSGGDALVVEGWLEEPELHAAFTLAQDTAYRHIYTTGTVRPFAYYLRDREGIELQCDQGLGGTAQIDVSGTGGAGFTLICGMDTVLHQAVGPSGSIYEATVPAGTRDLRILSWNTNPNDGRSANIFILFFRIDRQNAHRRCDRTRFLRPDGRREEAWPTYAHRARGLLIEYGIAPDRITAVPSWGRPDSRTWSNASHFAVQAQHDGLHAFDIATLGVHARRSRALFQKAAGPDVRVGVISIPDPYCLPGNWWKSQRGWITLMKEIIGAPEVQALELTR